MFRSVKLRLDWKLRGGNSSRTGSGPNQGTGLDTGWPVSWPVPWPVSESLRPVSRPLLVHSTGPLTGHETGWPAMWPVQSNLCRKACCNFPDGRPRVGKLRCFQNFWNSPIPRTRSKPRFRRARVRGPDRIRTRFPNRMVSEQVTYLIYTSHTYIACKTCVSIRIWCFSIYELHESIFDIPCM